MRKSSRVARLMLTVAALAMTVVFTACPSPPPLNPLTLLPTDPNPSCVVTPTVFATWFQSGSVTLNGVVNPANSVTFPNLPNCSFYQWAQQDFLWLTSPAPPTYGGGGGIILNSPAFFDVSPPASDFSRTFLPHTSGLIRPFALRAAKPGPMGLQLTFDRTGRPLQVKAAEKGAKPLVRDVSGQTVEVAHARLEKGRPVLLDLNGRTIQTQIAKPPETRARIPEMITAQRFLIDGIPILIDGALAVVDVEQGEATTNGVMEAQLSSGASLVYYATIVNDVYAYFATGVKDGAITLAGNSICPAPNNCFPITAGDLSSITTFASAHGKTFPDPDALAIEVKSAWVVAAGLPNLSSYITMNATIPTYNPPTPTSTTTTMTPVGQQTVQLALVGIHVVGSTAGHPEMIWSTFEHVANAPAAQYSYVNTANAIATVKQSASTVPMIGGSSAPWLFSSPTPTSVNSQHMSFNSPDIVANTGFTISPSDTLRMKAFGGAIDVAPNPLDGLPSGGNPSTDAADTSNTEIISIDNSVGGMLVSGDVRRNYIMTGATWTIGGQSPDSFIGGNQVGTSSLSNTTMETYVQGPDTKQAGGTNCLSCHNSNTTGVSHVFGALKPLF